MVHETTEPAQNRLEISGDVQGGWDEEHRVGYLGALGALLGLARNLRESLDRLGVDAESAACYATEHPEAAEALEQAATLAGLALRDVLDYLRDDAGIDILRSGGAV